MPLLFDMPLEKLESYEGTNPRPGDFDAFWDCGLTEMRALDPALELRPAEFQTPFAECFDLFFTGVGGARVHAKFLRPKGIEAPHPAVLVFHGYSGSAGDWSDKLGFAAMGYSVAALDCRGQGGLSEDPGGVVGNTLRGHIIRGLDGPPENMLFRQIFLDTAQLADIVMAMPEVDATRVGVTGGTFREQVEGFKERLITDALAEAGGNQAAAARALGLSYHQYRYFLKKCKASSAGSAVPMRS